MMKNSKRQFFAKFTSNIFGGAISTFIAFFLLLNKFGSGPPPYSLALIIGGTVVGIILSEIVARKTHVKLTVINVCIFVALSTVYIILTDWRWAIGFAFISLVYSLVPATVITLGLHWQKISSTKS